VAKTLGETKIELHVGKWAQNQRKTQRTVVTSVKVLCKFLTSPDTEVTNFIFPYDDVVSVSWKHSKDIITAG